MAQSGQPPCGGRHSSVQSPHAKLYATISLVLGALSLFQVPTLIASSLKVPGFILSFLIGVYGVATAYLSMKGGRFFWSGLIGLIFSICGILISFFLCFLAASLAGSSDPEGVLKQAYYYLTQYSGLQ